MPLYAPFGNAIFGQTLFGLPPNVSVFTTLTVQPPIGAAGQPSPYAYSGLQIDWQPAPLNQFSGQVLVRSSYGIPTSIYDGTVLVSQLPQATPQAWISQYVDTGLNSGQFYYYALFVYSIALGQWVTSGTAQGLCLIDWGFGSTYTTWTPDFYLELDATVAPTPNYPNGPGPLTRFLELIGFETDWVRSEIESLLLLTNVDLISGALLPYMGANLGVSYEPVLGMKRSRVLVKNAIYLYKNKGTTAGIAAAASAFSGFGAKVSVGKNLEIQLDDCAFDQSVGHWVPGNSSSSITVANATPLGGSQHAVYDGATILPLISGYLPNNNSNVAVITAGASSTGGVGLINWAQLFPSTAPTARTLASMAYDTSTQTTFMFGGSSAGGYLNEMWSFSGTSWTNVTPVVASHPSQRYGMVMAYYTPGSAVIAFGGISGSTVYNDTWSYAGGVWTQLSPSTVPPARYLGGAAYDTSRTQFVMYGGVTGNGTVLNDTYLWSGTNWVKQTVGGTPGGLYNFGIAYGTAGQKIVMYGGTSPDESYEDDTYEWNGTTTGWVKTSGGVNSGQTSPTARVGCTMASYTSGGIVLFGGYDGTNYLQDTWSYTSGVWTQSSPGGATPPARANQVVLADNSGTNTLVMFGGFNGSTWLNDTWTFSGAGTWTNKTPANPPGVRSSPAAAFNGTVSVIFGGLIATATTSPDTWQYALAGNTWTQTAAGVAPSARSYAMMAYDALHNQVVLFGGLGASGFLGDTWTWSGTAWTLKAPGTSPSARFNCAVCYDTTQNLMYILGGQLAGGTTTNEMWKWDGTTWTQMTPATLPSGRHGHSMVYDPTSAPGVQILMYGGQNAAGTMLAETWGWNGTTWTNLAQAGPGGRAGHVLVYDAVAAPTQQVALYGGTSSYNVNVLSDTWTWNGSTWTQLVTSGSGTPTGRQGAVAAYSTAAQSIVLFGGANAAGSYLSDTYLLSGSAIPSQLQLTTTTSATALSLGIPCTVGTTYVLSAYVKPYPQATPVARQFQMRIDWYGVNGVLISSTTGAAVTESISSWVRAFVVGVAPAGALTFGRSIQSVGNVSGDLHMFDAEQVEISTQATPSPTSWEPPRDIKINLLPLRQNLIANPVGLGGTFGWISSGGTFVGTQSQAFFWPATTTSGFMLTANGSGNQVFSYASVPVNPGVSYTFSAYSRPITTARTVMLIVQFYSATSVFLGSTTTQFTEVAGTFTRGAVQNQVAPAGAATATVQVVIVTPVNTEQHAVSAVMVEPFGLLRTYFDSNFSPFTDYTFEGNPNLSISDYYPNLLAVVTRLTTALPEYIPIGSTFSLIIGQQALANANLVG
jgi:Phage tail protein (Tail_P2_I)/Galactose oxidase, central domain